MSGVDELVAAGPRGIANGEELAARDTTATVNEDIDAYGPGDKAGGEEPAADDRDDIAVAEDSTAADNDGIVDDKGTRIIRPW